ncbi:MAG: hypothetical protein KGH57_00305 [Candidatus Micrarchaeota archaeon]|nr:hypothetical protein [Candidatus Micrarchaeota archaeon]
MGETPGGLRAQVSIEFLLTFVAGLSVMIGAAYTLLGIGSSVGSVAAPMCNFDLGVACGDVIVTSNSTSTMFAMAGSNSQEYPITNLGLTVLVNGQPTNAKCTGGKIKPGQSFVCYAKLSAFQQPGSQSNGNITAHVGYCGFNGGDCNSAVPQNYVGTFISSTGSFKKPQIGLTLYAPNIRSNGPYTINATFDVFGYTLYVATINVTPQPGSQPKITYSGPGASSINVSVSTLSNGCAAVVNVTYANQTAVGVYSLNATNYTGGSYKLSGNTNGGCLALSQTTQTVSVSGKNNTAGLFTLSNVFINISSTGSQNNLAIFNSTATLKIAGNYNNVTMFDSNVVLDITGTYNRVKFVNSRISNLTASGNNNLVILDNTTVAQQSVTGTNDIIQGS